MSLDEQHAQALPRFFKAPAPRSDEEIAALIKGERSCLWVVHQDQRVAGLSYVFLRSTKDHPVRHSTVDAVLDMLIVQSAFRGRGLGGMLMEAAVAWAKAQAATGMELNVNNFNEGARRFYEARGFAPLSQKYFKEI